MTCAVEDDVFLSMSPHIVLILWCVSHHGRCTTVYWCGDFQRVYIGRSCFSKYVICTFWKSTSFARCTLRCVWPIDYCVWWRHILGTTYRDNISLCCASIIRVYMPLWSGGGDSQKVCIGLLFLIKWCVCIEKHLTHRSLWCISRHYAGGWCGGTA